MIVRTATRHGPKPKNASEPSYFARVATRQSREFFWIRCSDTRGLWELFAIAQLVERRKALVVIVAALEDSFERFDFGPHHAFAHHCRDAMTPEDYNSFERKLFDLARLALAF